jgi:hypothetical protein
MRHHGDTTAVTLQFRESEKLAQTLLRKGPALEARSSKLPLKRKSVT